MSKLTGNPPRLLDQVREVIRIRHYSIRTEEAFLNDLAVQHNVAASTQNQALHAILFLYRDVLKIDLPWLNHVQRARKPQRLPVVFTREEVKALLAQLQGTV
jgi:site-specific recombinase XerD